MENDSINPYRLGIEPGKIYHFRGTTLQFFIWAINWAFRLSSRNTKEIDLLEKSIRERVERIVNKEIG